MDYAIQTKDLSKRFGSYHANSNISLCIPKGEIYGLIGRNGAGKTTFMRMLLDLLKPTSGTISLLGQSGDKGLDEARKKVGSIIEVPAFYDDMTVYENIMIRAKLIGLHNATQEIQSILTEVGLWDRKHDHVKKLSLGMRQKLGIACAVLGKPELLILDEPINGLDPIAIVEIRKILQRLNKENGTTILISSHILGEMEKVATSYGFIVDGKLVKELSAKEVTEQNIDLEKFFMGLIGVSDDE